MAYEMLALTSIAEFVNRGLKMIFKNITVHATGAMTLEHWAKVATRAANSVANQVRAKEDLTYIGGYVTFCQSYEARNLIDASIELYFQDRNNQWHKTESNTQIRSENFNASALSQIRSNNGAAFELD